VVEVANGELLSAWFGGTHEGHPDIAIWLARFDGRRWSEPFLAADEPGVPLWNPVLFRDEADVVWLFFKVGPSVPAWTGAYLRSHDGGETWGRPSFLPAGLLGPIKNKPLLLSNGDILCGTSSESWRSWACWVEISTDGGGTWSKHGPIVAPGYGTEEGYTRGDPEPVSAVWDEESRQLRVPQAHCGIIQPTIWEHAPGQLKMLVRATQRVGYVCAAHSQDYGRTWSHASPTAIPNPNAGLDAIHLADGRIVLACNPTHEGRSPLSLLTSEDNGETWPYRLDLETVPGEFSYPSIIQAADGRIHAVYTYCRRWIQHAVLDPDQLE
jgi:predicted neuraminidase